MAETKVTPVQISNPYKATAYRSSNQSLPDNTNTTVVFDAERFDTSNNYNTSNGRFTAPIAGFYQVSCNLTVEDDGQKYVGGTVWMYINETAYTPATNTPYPGISNASGFMFTMSELVQLAANDYVTFRAAVDTSDSTSSQVKTNSSASFYLSSTS